MKNLLTFMIGYGSPKQRPTKQGPISPLKRRFIEAAKDITDKIQNVTDKIADFKEEKAL